MAPLSTAPVAAQNTWTCPTCKHGSPDPRDERAHLDAHRQLGQFLREWDAAVESDRKKEQGRRPVAAVLGALAVIVALVAAIVFLGLVRTGGSSDPAARPVPRETTPAPEAAAPAPTIDAGPQPPAAQGPGTTAQAPPQVSTPPRAVAPPAAVASTATAAVAAPESPAPVASGPSAAETSPRAPTLQSFKPDPAVSPPGYLLKVCVVGTCLTVP